MKDSFIKVCDGNDHSVVRESTKVEVEVETNSEVF